jgi:proline iminopeptidase
MILARAAAVVIAAGIAACASPRGPAPLADEGYFAGADSVRLFYRIYGRGGDTVVVVHGFQGNAQGYLAADLLPLARGRTLLFYDQRGGGRSQAVTDTAWLGIESHVRDLEALRRHFGFRRMTLLGHSGGAAVAARYAMEHADGVARLLLVAPPPPVRAPYAGEASRSFAARLDSATWRRLAALQATLPTAADPEAVCHEIASTVLPRAYFADPRGYRRMRGDFCAQPPDRLRTQPARVAAFQRTLPDDWRPGLRGIAIPVLLIHGEHDAIPVAASREWAASLPDARLLVLTAADHLPWIEQPARFFRAADRFLQGEWPTGTEPP